MLIKFTRACIYNVEIFLRDSADNFTSEISMLNIKLLLKLIFLNDNMEMGFDGFFLLL